jgi:hypothetical protein
LLMTIIQPAGSALSRARAEQPPAAQERLALQLPRFCAIAPSILAELFTLPARTLGRLGEPHLRRLIDGNGGVRQELVDRCRLRELGLALAHWEFEEREAA